MEMYLIKDLCTAKETTARIKRKLYRMDEILSQLFIRKRISIQNILRAPKIKHQKNK
jgi:hypothetical protein